VDARGDVGGEADFGKPQERSPNNFGCFEFTSVRSSDLNGVAKEQKKLFGPDDFCCVSEGATMVREVVSRAFARGHVELGWNPVCPVMRHEGRGGERERPTTRTPTRLRCNRAATSRAVAKPPAGSKTSQTPWEAVSAARR
jgi:hypothetical protein